MKAILISGALLLALQAGAQDGLEKRNIGAAQRILVNGDVDVYLKQSTENSLSASADDFRNISYEESDGQIIINGGDARLYLNLNEVREIVINGASDIYSSDTLRSRKLVVRSTGNGDGNLLLVADTVDVTISGASDVRLAGKGQYLRGKISGAGDIKAGQFPVSDADVAISGAGDAKIFATNQLRGSVSGAGTLYHVGTPANIDVTVSGAGEVKKANDIDGEARISLGTRELIIIDRDSPADTSKDIGDSFRKGFNDGMEQARKKKRNKPQSIWSAFELGINGWLNGSNGLNMDSVNSQFALNYNKSVVVNINLFERHAKIIGNNLYLTTGLGTEINNYRYDQNIRMVANSNPLTLVNEDSVSYRKSKFTIGYLNVPLYLTFATNPIRGNNRIHISPGLTAGWRYTSYNKRKMDIDGDVSKNRIRDDFNLNPFRVNASLRVGYGDFVLFANYSLTDLFIKDKGPDLIPFSVGVRLVGLGD